MSLAHEQVTILNNVSIKKTCFLYCNQPQPIHVMKKVINLSTLCFLFISSTTYGQLYSNPEPSGSAPISVPVSTAESEANGLVGSCGYSGGFFSKSDLQFVMGINKVIGVRIYNSKESSGQQYTDIIMAGVDGNGKERVKTFTKSYVHAASVNSDANCSAQHISTSYAKGCVNNVASNGSLEYQKVYFSNTVIDQLLNSNGSVNGLKVIPGMFEGHSTMLLAPASLSNGKLTVIGNEYLKSRLPCPIDCGDESNYLVPLK